MKKSTPYVLIAITLLFAVSSCNKFLDIKPITEQTEDSFYRTETDAFQALVAVYDVLQWQTPNNQNVPFELISEFTADCVYGGGSNANDIPGIVKMSRWDMDKTDQSYDALWWKYYVGIYRANLFLEKFEQREEGPNTFEFKTPGLKARMISEAKFLRAYFYFDLVRLFGNVPLILKTLAPSEYYTPVQATPDQVYAQIKDDLEFSIKNGLPPLTSIPKAETGRISKHAAEALLARVFLFYTGVYGKTDLAGLTKAQVTAYLEDVIENSGADLLQNYADLWDADNKNHKESIFDIQYTQKSSWGDWGYRVGSEGNQAVILWSIRDVEASAPYSAGWSFAPIRKSLWDDFQAGDTRRDATLINMELEGYKYTAGFLNTGIFNKKYTALKVNDAPDGSRELNYKNNYQCIRFADVLLMGAELQIGQNNDKAQTYYSRVVKRAFGAQAAVLPVTTQRVWDERLFELALEGHRFWDIKRMGLDRAKQIIEKENSILPAEYHKIFDLKYNGLFPIPQVQITMAKQLNQNAGY